MFFLFIPEWWLGVDEGRGSLSSSSGSEPESLEGKLRFRQSVLQRLGSLGTRVTLTPHIQGT